MKDEIFNACIAAQKESGGKPFWNRLNEELKYGKTGEQLRNDVKREKKRRGYFDPNNENYQEPETNESSSYEQGDDFINIVCASKRILNKDDIIKQFNIDTNIWEIDRFKVKTSEGYRKDRSVEWHVKDGKVSEGDVSDSGKMLVVPLYHIQVSFKHKIKEWNTDNISQLFENLEKKDFSHISYTPRYVKNSRMLLYPIADLHLGLLSTKKTSGNDYNIEQALELCEKTTSQILSRIENQQYEKISLVLGNDFLNSDNLAGSTTKGTPQDNDSFWYEMTDAAVEIIIKTINSLLPYAPIDVYQVYSNHDEQSMYGVMRAVQFYFKEDKNVTFNISALPRTYFTFGKNLIGLSHDIPIKKSLELITTEAKDLWSNSEHMYWILAHLHQAMAYDKQGYLEIYRLPTISGWSRWTTKNGYVQTDKKTQCFVFDKETGITDIMNIVVK